MKPIAKAAALVLVAVAGWYHFQGGTQAPAHTPEEATALGAADAGDAAQRAFEQRESGLMLRVQGRVERLLADDRDGSPHQRFIIVTDSGQSLLVAHNLDLAPRLDGLAVGDQVGILGQYEWNPQGGVMHWTHDDPDGSHAAGYINWQGRKYQ